MTGEHSSVIYGTHYPYRLFVGCLPPDAGAEDLGVFFSHYGNVVEAKVVLDENNRSKRFGFVTFSNKDNVADLIKSKAIKFKGKMINVGPAVKKNLDSQGGESNSTPRPVMQKGQLKQDSPPAGPQTTTASSNLQNNNNKQSIYRAPQHLPKTVIRRSPVEQHFTADANTADLIRVPPSSTNVPQRDDSSFCSTWGISNRKSSVWSRSSSQTQSHGSSRSSSLENLDAPPQLQQLQQHVSHHQLNSTNLSRHFDVSLATIGGHHHHDSALSPGLTFEHNPWTRMGSYFDGNPWFSCSGSIAPPPGFGRQDMFSKK